MSELKLYLFVGYPGAGKTTTAKLIAQETGAVHLWVDAEWRKMFGVQAVHSQADSMKLYDYLNQRTDELLATGQSVIYDTNFNFRADRDTMRAIAAKHNARTVLIWLTTPKEVARERAVEHSQNQPNRALGNINPEEFSRISNNLQPPTADEQAITIDGTAASVDAIKQALQLS